MQLVQEDGQKTLLPQEPALDMAGGAESEVQTLARWATPVVKALIAEAS